MERDPPSKKKSLDIMVECLDTELDMDAEFDVNIRNRFCLYFTIF